VEKQLESCTNPELGVYIMPKRRFRTLLSVYFLCVILSATTGPIEKRVIPPDVLHRAEGATFVLMPEIAFVIRVTVASILAAGIVTWVVGYIGLWFFWRPSRYLFMGAVLFKIAASLGAVWGASSGFGRALGELELLLEGVIVCCSFWGDARPLFVREPTSHRIESPSS